MLAIIADDGDSRLPVDARASLIVLAAQLQAVQTIETDQCADQIRAFLLERGIAVRQGQRFLRVVIFQRHRLPDADRRNLPTLKSPAALASAW